LQSYVSEAIINVSEGASSILNHLKKMVLHSWEDKRLISEYNAIPIFSNNVTKSPKGKASNVFNEVLTLQERGGPMEILSPRSVPPRQIASPRPKESNAGCDRAIKKQIIYGIRQPVAKRTGSALYSTMRQ